MKLKLTIKHKNILLRKKLNERITNADILQAAGLTLTNKDNDEVLTQYIDIDDGKFDLPGNQVLNSFNGIDLPLTLKLPNLPAKAIGNLTLSVEVEEPKEKIQQPTKEYGELEPLDKKEINYGATPGVYPLKGYQFEVRDVDPESLELHIMPKLGNGTLVNKELVGLGALSIKDGFVSWTPKGKVEFPFGNQPTDVEEIVYLLVGRKEIVKPKVQANPWGFTDAQLESAKPDNLAPKGPIAPKTNSEQGISITPPKPTESKTVDNSRRIDPSMKLGDDTDNDELIRPSSQVVHEQPVAAPVRQQPQPVRQPTVDQTKSNYSEVTINTQNVKEVNSGLELAKNVKAMPNKKGNTKNKAKAVKTNTASSGSKGWIKWLIGAVIMLVVVLGGLMFWRSSSLNSINPQINQLQRNEISEEKLINKKQLTTDEMTQGANLISSDVKTLKGIDGSGLGNFWVQQKRSQLINEHNALRTQLQKKILSDGK